MILNVKDQLLTCEARPHVTANMTLVVRDLGSWTLMDDDIETFPHYIGPVKTFQHWLHTKNTHRDFTMESLISNTGTKSQ